MSDFIRIGPDQYVRKSSITSVTVEKMHEGGSIVARRVKMWAGGQQITAHQMDVDELMGALGIDAGG